MAFNHDCKVVGLVPAFNAERTIINVLNRIPEGILDELIILNDGSTDRTLHLLRSYQKIPIHIISNSSNQGYSSAQKRLYNESLKYNPDIIVIFHSDEGHFPEELPLLVNSLKKSDYDIACGSRIRNIDQKFYLFPGLNTLWRSIKGSMPAHRYISNKMLSFLFNILIGGTFLSYHCGFRAVKAHALQKLRYHDFFTLRLFDAEFLINAFRMNLKIIEIPVSPYYSSLAGSKMPALRYGLECLYYMFLILKEKRHVHE